MRSFLWTMLFAIASLASLGCGKWPPVVNSKADVARLSANEPSIRARSLPDDEISSLARLTELKRIDFQGGWASYKANITDAGLAELAKLHLSMLEEIDLGRCPEITNSGLEQIGKISTLTWVFLDENPNVTDDGLLKLKDLKNLKFLRLWGCKKITDAAIDNIRAITSLEELDFSECDQITDAALAKLVKFENLKRLNANGCAQLTDEGIQQLAAKKNWEFIGLSGCKQVTDVGVAKLQAALPGVSVQKDESLWKHNKRK